MTAIIPQSLEERAIAAALSGTSANTQRVYRRHLTAFLAYLSSTGYPLTRETVERYLTTLTGIVTYNQALSAIKRLALEAAAHGWHDYETAVRISSLPSKKLRGQRLGNWLSHEQAAAYLKLPDLSSLPGKRDYAALCLLMGCGLRREEAAALSVNQLQVREGRAMLVDILGKGNRLRSVKVPAFALAGVQDWLAAAAIESGPLLRSFRRGGRVNGSLSVSALWQIVTEYAGQLAIECSPHDLRRTFAKLARKGGAALESIQKSLGHSSIRTTEIYVNSGEEADAGDYLSL